MAKNEDGGAAEVAEKLADEQEAGGRGAFVDPTPNHAYTVAGVTSGEPTPETDAALAREAREALRLGETKFDHGESETSTTESESTSSAGETKLTGEALEARLAELKIDASTGGSNADGSMSADEKRAAIAEAEASGNGS